MSLRRRNESARRPFFDAVETELDMSVQTIGPSQHESSESGDVSENGDRGGRGDRKKALGSPRRVVPVTLSTGSRAVLSQSISSPRDENFPMRFPFMDSYMITKSVCRYLHESWHTERVSCRRRGLVVAACAGPRNNAGGETDDESSDRVGIRMWRVAITQRIPKRRWRDPLQGEARERPPEESGVSCSAKTGGVDSSPWIGTLPGERGGDAMTQEQIDIVRAATRKAEKAVERLRRFEDAADRNPDDLDLEYHVKRAESGLEEALKQLENARNLRQA